jgi:hypothetical protein
MLLATALWATGDRQARRAAWRGLGSNVFCYERELDRRFLIALNVGSHRAPLALGDDAPSLLSWSCPLIPDESTAPSTCGITCLSPTKA